MAILNNSNAITTTGGYDVNNSLRFRRSASAYLSRTPASAGSQTTWTWSGWVKRSIFGSQQKILTAGSTGSLFASFEFISGDNFQFYAYNGATNAYLVTTQVFRDPSAWYHIVFAVDTTQATASNRIKIYVNGTQVTAFSTSTYPSQNFAFPINNNVIHNIGRDNINVGDYFDGYLAETHFIDGSQKAASDFGSTDATTGVWQPKSYTGTYGTNGFYLKFSDIATTSGSNAGLGKDFSGNTNYWTTNNISVTSGTTYDAMTDVPTNTSATVANYCVLNPLNKSSGMTLSQANLRMSMDSAGGYSARGTIASSSGKWYAEAFVQNKTTQTVIGVCDVNLGANQDPIVAPVNAVAYYANTGGRYVNGGSLTAYGATYTTNDIIGIALDMDGLTVTFYKNNVSQGSIALGTTGLSYTFFGGDENSLNTQIQWNFGQRPFSYTPPTGYVALNTYNLPTPTILQGNTVMDATLWTGNGASSRSITNAASFRPDFVWIKSRSNAFWHQLYDAVRGVQQAMYSNSTNAELTETTGLTAFNSNGFTVSSGSGVNENASTFVGWQWQAGSSTVTNTSGSISSQVRANTTAGFSIVTWTGNGTNGATIGHGLGVAPRWVIVKRRNSSGDDWLHYHISLGATQSIAFDTAAAITSSTRWNNTAPSSTLITLGTSTGVNGSGATYVAYCWAEIAGFSRFGSYTGNSSSDGPFIYTGFRPKFVIVKRSSSTGPWEMLDSSRNTYNVTENGLRANAADAEGTGIGPFDFLSNGFKLRGLGGVTNDAGTFIYMAFAENPFSTNNRAR
jgi:hypothetical protein